MNTTAIKSPKNYLQMQLNPIGTFFGLEDFLQFLQGLSPKQTLFLSRRTCNAIYRNSDEVHVFCSSVSFQQAPTDGSQATTYSVGTATAATPHKGRAEIEGGGDEQRCDKPCCIPVRAIDQLKSLPISAGFICSERGADGGARCSC